MPKKTFFFITNLYYKMDLFFKKIIIKKGEVFLKIYKFLFFYFMFFFI